MWGGENKLTLGTGREGDGGDDGGEGELHFILFSFRDEKPQRVREGERGERKRAERRPPVELARNFRFEMI
jgi:hypothetical protein